MSELHVVVGAGPVGRATALELVAAGHEVLLVSRSGSGPDLPGVRRAAADAADADRLAELAAGAVAIYNCVNPSDYTVWSTFWPPVAEAFLVAAERTGAVLVTASCLYGYGPVDGPMVEGLPDAATTKKALIRAGMWAEAQGAPRGRPDPGGRGARLRLHGARRHGRGRAHRPGRAGRAGGQDRAGDGAARRAALVHRRARHGAGAGRRGRRRRRPGAGCGTRRPTRRSPRRRPWPTSAGRPVASR